MKKYLFAILIVGSLLSCNRHTAHWDTLCDVESYIENRPDSALHVLEQIDRAKLTNRSESAKYALLYSMALDKNYIDREDFDVLQDAIDYYKHHGSYTDKMRTCYYQGRIYQNMGDKASAVHCYLIASEYGLKSDDILTKARICVAQGNIYFDMMKWPEVCAINLQAADYFISVDRYSSYVNCMIKAACGYMELGDFEQAKQCLERCAVYVEDVAIGLQNYFYSTLIICCVGIGDEHLIRAQLVAYMSIIPDNYICYNSVALAYQKLGMYDDAFKAMQRVDYGRDKESEMRYYAILTNLNEQQGNYKEAYMNYKKLNELYSDVIYDTFNYDIQFIENKYKAEIENIEIKTRNGYLLMLGCVVLLLLLVYILYIRIKLKHRTMERMMARKEVERQKLLCQQLEYEKENLMEVLLNNQHENEVINDVVMRRLELLNDYFAANISHNQSLGYKVDKELNELLEDRDQFMSSTRLAYTRSHPDFIKYLVDHELTEREIGYCCLCALGLKGKEVGAYMQLRSHYNISSNVRTKLGLDGSDTNLSIYIRNLVLGVK